MAQIQSLAREIPYATTGAAIKKKKLLVMQSFYNTVAHVGQFSSD